MPWVNYHSHCNYCDGSQAAGEYVQAAMEAGFIVWGFSSHCPLPFENSWSMDSGAQLAYLAEINDLKEKWKEQIQVYAGMEVDFIPGVCGPESKMNRFPELDFSIGSIHHVDAFEDGSPWEIDGTYKLFKKGLHQIFNNDARAAITRYFELTRWMLLLETPDILGHLDKIKIHQNKEGLFSEEEEWYRMQVIKTLKVMSNTHAVLEVNTRGLYKGHSLDVYPSRWILQIANDFNIPVTISSDAHEPEEAAAGFSFAARILQEVGYKQVAILHDGIWKDVNFDESGIEIPPETNYLKQALGA